MHSFTHAQPRTLAIEDRDHAEWRRGREHYGIWMIDADIAPVRERVARARDHLGDLLAAHRRPAHITLFVCGFHVDAAMLDDDFDPAMLAVQRRALRSVSVAPFTLMVGGLDSFDSAVFLQVSDNDGGLTRLRAELAKGRDEIRQTPYTAHLTVGLYRDAFDKREVSRRLTTFTDTSPIEVPADRVHFATYTARTLGGSFDVVETHRLQEHAGVVDPVIQASDAAGFPR